MSSHRREWIRKVNTSTHPWREESTPPQDSDVHVLGLNSFCDKKLNFHHAYLDTDWGISTVALAGVGILLMKDIPVYGTMEKLQHSYPNFFDDLVEMPGININ